MQNAVRSDQQAGSRNMIVICWLEPAGIGVSAPGQATATTAWQESDRETPNKEFFFYPFEAGMCMKTKKTQTKCPSKNRKFKSNYMFWADKSASTTVILQVKEAE